MITLQRLVKRALFHQMELQSSVFLRICAYLRILVISRDQPPLRAAHRRTVTRLVNQLDEALHSTDVGRLKNLKQTLSKKMTILSALDEGILAEVEEDQVEAEIEQADLIREEAELAIIGIDEALLSLKHESRRKPPSKRRSSSLSSGDEDDPTLSRPSQAMNIDEPDSILQSHCPQAVTEPLVTFSSFGSHLSVTATPFSPSVQTPLFPPLENRCLQSPL